MPIRNMTLAEKQLYAQIFPALDVDRQPRVTGEATRTYNCIAWTVGITTGWINPLQTMQQWNNFYARFGLVNDDDGGDVAIWRNGPTYTHGCVATGDEVFDWESKCGRGLRLRHDADELVGFDRYGYGTIFTYFRRAVEERNSARLSVSGAKSSPMNIDDKIAAVRARANELDPSQREAFLELFNAWKTTWFTGDTAFSSNTRDFAAGYAYDSLVKMGPEILPLVVEQLIDPENFVANQLVYELQDPKLRLGREPTGPDAALTEQDNSKLIIASFVSGQK